MHPGLPPGPKHVSKASYEARQQRTLTRAQMAMVTKLWAPGVHPITEAVLGDGVSFPITEAVLCDGVKGLLPFSGTFRANGRFIDIN